MKVKTLLMLVLGSLILVACASRQPDMEVNAGSVRPGGEVTRKGITIALKGEGIAVGQRLPDIPLIDAQSGQEVTINALQGQVLLLSIVPSVDTRVCEAQTHSLGEEGDSLPQGVRRITISRDTPFAQARFAKDARLEDIQYLSDYKQGAFGRSVGLLMEGPMLLARAVLVLDREGVVRYIQVVPEITQLPDMETAFIKAVELAGTP